MQALSFLTQNTGGIVNKAALVGSADPDKYMQRWPRDLRKPGGYQLQMSPHDIAALINHVRPNLKGKRMLCVGVETFGAERFIAEELGMLEIDVIYNHGYGVDAAKNMSELSGVRFDRLSGTYDLITLFGDNEFNLSAILQYAHIGTQVACLGTSSRNNAPDVRRCWYELRRLHTPILQTVDNYDMGVGVAKIIFKEELNAFQKHKTEGLFVRRETRDSQGISSSHATGSETTTLREHGEQDESQQPAQAENHPGQESAGNPGRSQEETGRESPDSSPLRERRSEDSQESVAAPYGRKLDGTPKKRPGRPV